MGFCIYYRPFVPYFAHIVKPLTRLKEERRMYDWNGECQEVFEGMKQKLTRQCWFPRFRKESLCWIHISTMSESEGCCCRYKAVKQRAYNWLLQQGPIQAGEQLLSGQKRTPRGGIVTSAFLQVSVQEEISYTS